MEHVVKRYWGRTLVAFLVVLCAMPLGHALMILMEHFLPDALSLWEPWDWVS